MNQPEAENAILQMISFIEKEAQDRAEDIRKKTEEEYTLSIDLAFNTAYS
jgi:flagellar biosynthesis/type III secretory pathway protein FliH